MAGEVVDLEIDTLVLLAFDGVSARTDRRRSRGYVCRPCRTRNSGDPVLPGAFEIAGGDGGLLRGGADDGVVGGPVRFPGENIVSGFDGVAARDHFQEGTETLLLAAAGIVELEIAVVANVGEIAGVEESAVVGELGRFVAVAETAGGVAEVEGHVDDVARGNRLVERIDQIDAMRTGTHEVKRPVEGERGN